VTSADGIAPRGALQETLLKNIETNSMSWVHPAKQMPANSATFTNSAYSFRDVCTRQG
jgi:hypothetical protein